MPRTKRKATQKTVTVVGTSKFGSLKFGGAATRRVLRVLKTGRFRATSGEAAPKLQSFESKHGLVKIVRMTLKDAAISPSEFTGEVNEMSDTQRAKLAAARARAEARLRQPDMSAEALQARVRAGAKWEGRHGPVKAFAGVKRAR